MKTTSQYCSADDNNLFQANPTFRKPSQFKAKGWTDTVEGYLNEAKQWAMCINRNRALMKRPYTWAVHLNLNEEVAPDYVASMWNKVKRKLKDRGIVCLWVREVNRLNKIHYHLIVKNHISETALKHAIEHAMPPRSEVKWRKRVEPIKSQWHLAHYVVKAKIAGESKTGKFVKDLYRSKRLLFRPHLGFRKAGTIGEFWEQGKNKTKIWKDIQAREKRIGEGLEDPDVRKLVTHVADMMGDGVKRSRIERSFGYSAHSKPVQEWINSLIAIDWSDDPWLIGSEFVHS
jgi:hypothetical protein